MAFLKGVKDTIEVPVTIRVSTLDENDESTSFEIHPIVTYRRFKRTAARNVQIEVAKISQEAAKAFDDGDIAALFGDRLVYFDDLLRENILGWRKMPGADDADVPFSKEVLEEALEDQAYYEGLMAGLRSALGWKADTAADGSEAAESKN